MKVTEHAMKRFDIILGDYYARQELIFMHRFLLPGNYIITWNKGIQIQDISLFSRRCSDFGVKFLGLETHSDSSCVLFIHTYEDFNLQYAPEWITGAIKELILHKVTHNIIPTVSVPQQILKLYIEGY
jgi:hypothetical protein